MERDDDADLAALAACFREHQALVNGVVHDRCGDLAIAEEITAQTFEAAAIRYAQGRGDEVTPGWLTVVARRRLIDHWRHLSARERAVQRLAVRADTDSADVTTGVATDDDLTGALDRLPPRQRTALTLRHVDGWSVSDIASGLGVSYLAAESLLSRARRSLAASLRVSDGPEPRTGTS